MKFKSLLLFFIVLCVTNAYAQRTIESFNKGWKFYLGKADNAVGESIKAKEHKAFIGLCLAVIQSKEKAGNIKLTAAAEGSTTASLNLSVK